jgi:hypothetical protein
MWFPFQPHEPVLAFADLDRHVLRQRLATDGLVVVRDVVAPTACAAAARGMAAWLRRRGVDPDDPSTWSRYTPEHFEMAATIPGMMNTGPIRRAAFVGATRARPEVRRLFELLYGTARLRMEDGGVFWSFPPERHVGAPARRGGDGFAHWRDMWMHSDRGRRPATDPETLLTTLVLEDSGLLDYGFVYMSQSHRHHDEFFEAHPAPLSMEAPGGVGGYVQLAFEDTNWFEGKGSTWRKVVAPKGSVIVWSDRLVHSTCLPVRGRPSPKPRFVLYGGFRPATRSRSRGT